MINMPQSLLAAFTVLAARRCDKPLHLWVPTISECGRRRIDAGAVLRFRIALQLYWIRTNFTFNMPTLVLGRPDSNTSSPLILRPAIHFPFS